MQKPVIISCDSTCDLSQELIDRYDIKILPLTILLGEDSFFDGNNFTPSDMYQRYRADGTLPKTSAPSIQQFLDFFKTYTDKGYDIVHLDISAKLSSTYNTACIAAEECGTVYVIDTKMLSTGVGLLAIEGAECAQKGMSAKDIYEHLNSLTSKVDTSFVLDTLEFMWKGGRCNGITVLGANLLKLKPGLEMVDGELKVYKKFRGNITAVYKQYIKERLSGKNIRPGHVFLTESGEIEESVLEELKAYIHELINVDEVHHTIAGCTVSSHCGPKTLGVLFIQK